MSIFAATHVRATAIVTAIGLVLGGLFLAQPAMADSAPPDPTNPATPVTVTDDVLPAPQIDGVVWAQTVVGNTVYVAGKFTTARPAGSAPGVNTVARNNLLAYDITTGVLISSFAPNLNAQALGITASPDGSRIYVVGDFTAIDGVGYYRIAAFNTATRAIIPSFKPIMQSQTRAVAASNTTVYTGGIASSVNGLARANLAAINAANGATLDWTANTDAEVTALALTKDGSRLIVGGRFQNISGVPNIGLGAVDATSAAVLPWAANQKVQDWGPNSSITSLIATADRVYGSGYKFGSGGNLEGIFSADPTTGTIQWIEDCHGDTYSVFPLGDAVYGVGHAHYCGNIGGFPQTSPTWTYHHSLAFSKAATGTITGPDPYGYFNWAGNPSPTLQDWFPNWVTGKFTGQGQATWSLSGNDKYLVVGGEFPSVDGVAQQGLVRFALPSIAPNKIGPSGAQLVPTSASFKTGEVRIGWTATTDKDNGYLTYKVYRDNGTTPVYQVTQRSNFYTRPAMGFTDTGLVPGSTHIYHVRVYDPFSNTTSRDAPTITVATQDSGGAYADAVTADGAASYWPLDETSGTAGFDHVGFTDLQLQSGVTRGATGPVSGVTASTFDGTANGFAVTPSAIAGPNTFTTETWIRTTTTTGGKIIGFGNANTGTSTSYDRQVYMDNAGKIWFGVYTGATRTVNSTASFNDGQWHQVVASLGANGMRLYVDGKRVGSRTDVTAGQAYNGYWRIGGDNLNSWPSKPTSNFFNGDIGQVALYPTVLGPTTIGNHYVASGRPSPFPPAPADSYGAAVYNQSPDLYWRLGESSGTTANDAGPFQSNGTYAGAVTLGQSGAISGVADTSVKLTTSKTGSNWKGGTAASVQQYSNPTTYSLELWFSTTTTVGGKLIGFGSSQTGLSSTYDRHVYMQDNGKLVFGTYTGQTNIITSPNSYNNGQWHHVVATQASDGMMLYVDGALVGTNPQTAAQAYNGYWRIGGDSTWGSTSPYFAGKLDEVAVYSSELSAQTVANHYSLGTAGVIPNQSPIAAFTSSAIDLTASFDGSTSSDSDGTVAGYAWDFGDGTSGTGATTTHAYAAGGSYQVILTVTDNQGATGAVTRTVTVTAPPPNQPPVAAFTSSAVNLAASFDGSTSSDPDGTVAGYAWDFGDGTTGTGATTTHTFGAAGTFTVALTVTDNKGATGTVTHDVTVTAPPANQPPVAAFTSSAVNLAASFDGSTSSDPDGTVAGYAWNFGDGSTGTGATASHTYAAAGTYTVTLTVTDNVGATNATSKSVTVAAPPANTIAQDAFERATTNGWGSADVGGPWTLAGGSTSFLTGGGFGQQVAGAGQTKTATLGGVSSTNADLQATISIDKAATGGGAYVSAIGRAVGSATYEARVLIKSTGVVQLQLLQGATTLQALNLPGITYAAGDQLRVRVQVFGTSPTTIRAKVWPVGQTEPAAWQLSATDTTAALQVAGSVGLRTYISASATAVPVTARFDDFIVSPAQ